MKKILFLVAFFILAFVACGCISSEQTVNVNNSQPTLFTPTPTSTIPQAPVPYSSPPTRSPEWVSYQKGLELYTRGNYQEAIEALNTSISLNKTNGYAYFARGKAFYKIGMMKQYEYNAESEFDQAISDFNHAERYGLSPEEKVEMAKLRGYSNYWIGSSQVAKYYLNGKSSFSYFEMAVKNFSSVLDGNPDDVDALIGRSLSNSRLGAGTREIKYPYDQNKVELSGKDARRANELAPENAWSHYALAKHILTAEKGNNEAVIKQLDEAIKDEADEAIFYFERGFYRMENGDYDGARGDFLKTLELQPRFATAYIGLASVEKDTNKDLQSSLVYTQKALEINPNVPLWWHNFGYSQLLLMRPVTLTGLEEALSSFDRAIDIDPEYFDAHYRRCEILIWLNRIPEAREEVRICKTIEGADREKIQKMEEITDNPKYYGNYVIRT